ncbi:MAG: terpene cyclase/mutase family protein [Anaerolineae bacterium]|nr:terpene cyclase/mutase family protein [Thermoflexales bacterium]MDW8408108.1 terpene cyclase/mutase family protein [Anaerolineae bacterium]
MSDLTKTQRGLSSRLMVLTALVLSTSLTPLAVHGASPSSTTEAGAKAVSWLISKQERDGGFSSGFAPGSDLSATADAVLALAAAGKSITQTRSSAGRTPLDFLTAQMTRRKLSTGQVAKLALAAKAAGQNPARFGFRNLPRMILAGYNAETGVIGEHVFSHGLALIALANAGVKAPTKAITTLESLQDTSGGWAFMGSGTPDVDTTALAIQALIASGRSPKDKVIERGLGYLKSIQNDDGGFPYQNPSQYGTETNANSTALVVQALIAAGIEPEAWAAAKGNPLSALIALQQPSGSIAYQASMPGDNTLATVGAIPALYRVSLIAK